MEVYTVPGHNAIYRSPLYLLNTTLEHLYIYGVAVPYLSQFGASHGPRHVNKECDMLGCVLQVTGSEEMNEVTILDLESAFFYYYRESRRGNIGGGGEWMAEGNRGGGIGKQMREGGVCVGGGRGRERGGRGGVDIGQGRGGKEVENKRKEEKNTEMRRGREGGGGGRGAKIKDKEKEGE